MHKLNTNYPDLSSIFKHYNPLIKTLLKSSISRDNKSFKNHEVQKPFKPNLNFTPKHANDHSNSNFKSHDNSNANFKSSFQKIQTNNQGSNKVIVKFKIKF